MSCEDFTLGKLYEGWGDFQDTLVAAVSPLTSEQLALRSAPHLRSAGELATHIVATRIGWFHKGLGEGSKNLDKYYTWQEHLHDAAELVAGLKETWQLIDGLLKAWKISDLDREVKATFRRKLYMLKRQWVIWHVIEHDLHHGGELLLTLGINHLQTPPVGMVTRNVREL